MRVLAVLYCYPPLLVPAAICYAKLMAGLDAIGVEVEIVTVSPETFVSPGSMPLDETLGPHLPHLRNHVIRSPETSLPVRLLKKLDSSRRFTRRWFEPRKREWIFPALRTLRHLDLNRYDVLLTCSQPHANHLLGLELKRAVGIPWVAYFSDPWTENPYASYSSPELRSYHGELEAEVLSSADRVLFTCKEMRDLASQGHSGLEDQRTGVLPHAYVPQWYDSTAPPQDAESHSRIRLLHTGSFYGPRSPLPLFESLQRISEDHDLPRKLKIDVYGGMLPAHHEKLLETGLRDVVTTHGFIPYLQTLSLMRVYDALLLVDAPLKGMSASVFLPSKLIDYLGSGAPVVAVTPDKGATARVVRETGGVVCPLESPGELDRFLRGLLAEKKSGAGVGRALVTAFEYRSVARHLLSVLESVAQRER